MIIYLFSKNNLDTLISNKCTTISYNNTCMIRY